jgi:hypothetical protein
VLFGGFLRSGKLAAALFGGFLRSGKLAAALFGGFLKFCGEKTDMEKLTTGGARVRMGFIDLSLRNSKKKMDRGALRPHP